MAMEFRLAPDSPEMETPETEEVTDQEDVEEAPEAESAEAKVARLEAELANQRTVNSQQIEELKKAVGRAQSLIDRSDRVSKDDLNAALDERYGSIYAILESIVKDADPTVFPDALRERIEATANEARSRNERKALVKEVMDSILPALAPAVPEPQIGQDASRVEQAILSELTAAGLDADDLDWKAADAVWLAQGEGGVLANARSQIAALVAEREAASRRESRKPTTPEQVKTTPGGGKTVGDVLLDKKASFADRMAALNALK